MKKIIFTKMVASGNDFIIAQLRAKNPELKKLARNICNRILGVGADGLLNLEKSRLANIRMRILNPDGSEAEMCGNGARCVAFWAKSKILKIETKAGIIEAKANKNNVKIKLNEPRDIKLNIPIKINRRTLRVNFINTGVPHAVIFVEGLDKIDVFNIGRQIRYHRRFRPKGTNVDFVEILNSNSIKIRTYERGVEDETLACGTGAVAAALIANCKLHPACRQAGTTNYNKINVHTKINEIVRVYFEKIDNRFKDVWLEGQVRIVYKGEYYVK